MAAKIMALQIYHCTESNIILPCVC